MGPNHQLARSTLIPPTLLSALLSLLLSGLLWLSPALAERVHIAEGSIQAIGPARDRLYQIELLIAHADSGWDHFAKYCEVLAPDGRVLATQPLFHPQLGDAENRRKLAPIKIPRPFTWVKVRASDQQHGSGRELTLSVPNH